MKTEVAPAFKTEDPTAAVSTRSVASPDPEFDEALVTVREQPSLPARRRPTRKLLIAASLVVALVVGLYFAVPEIVYEMHHVSTDDATVNSHVTYISARISDQTQEVLVDDNQFVERGTVLLRLDPEPYEIAVAQRQADLDRANVDVQQKIAALAVANAELGQARTQVRSQLAGLRASWYLVATVQDFVRYEAAALQSDFANLREQQANLRLAQEEFDRVNHLGPQNISQEEIDTRRSALIIAREQVNTAEQSVNQTQALLGLPQDVSGPTTLPSDVAQRFNGTQYALSSFMQSMTSLGVAGDAGSPTLNAIRDKFESLASGPVIENSPTVVAAKARVLAAQAALGGPTFDLAHPERQPGVVAAQKQLDEAQLELGYTEVRAPLAGFVSKRSVNPGTHVQAGQALMSIRPIQDAWIDANFKETQLKDITVGQKVDIYIDAYPGKVFHGRVSGFSPGTGAMMSLLPPENATGNYVKVVQRLPVRIDLTQENPKDTPLFAGLSAEPEIDLQSAPTGPDAGQRLLSAATNGAAAAPASAMPAGSDAAGAQAIQAQIPAEQR